MELNVAWLYDESPKGGCLDWLGLWALEKLDARPLWTKHFCSWPAFVQYVIGCDAGERTWYGWGTEDERQHARAYAHAHGIRYKREEE